MSRLLPRLQQLPNLSRALHQASSSQASAASLGPSLAGDHAPSARLNPLVAVGEGLSIRLPPNDGQAYFLPAPQPRTPAGLEVRAQENAIAEHAAHSTHLWRKLSSVPLPFLLNCHSTSLGCTLPLFVSLFAHIENLGLTNTSQSP